MDFRTSKYLNVKKIKLYILLCRRKGTRTPKNLTVRESLNLVCFPVSPFSQICHYNIISYLTDMRRKPFSSPFYIFKMRLRLFYVNETSQSVMSLL